MPLITRTAQSFTVVAVLLVACVSALAASLVNAPAEVRRAMTDMGLTPTMLATCGCDPTTASTILTRVQAAETFRTTLTTARDTLTQKKSDFQSLNRQRPTTAEQAVALSTQIAETKAAIETADAAFDQAKAALYAEATSALNTALLQTFTRWRSNTASTIPPEMKTVAWTDSERKRLEFALAAATGRQLENEHRELLEVARSRTEVQSAKTSLDTNLAAIQTAFEAE
jgi:hypothetical protein